jgi:hypothetical protein
MATIVNTGNPDGKIAVASRPGAVNAVEIEAADDFVLTSATSITSATFTGLLTGGALPGNVSQVRVEIYRVFPALSDTVRTINVPTRVNSPSDIALGERDSAVGNLTMVTSVLGSNFTANNSVLNGINKSPNQTTGGEGPVTGTEVQFNVSFNELVWQRASDGLVEIQFMHGITPIGGGAISNSPFDASFRVAGVGDFNADGNQDLMYRRISDGLTEVQFLNGTTPIGGGIVAVG